MHEFSLCRGLLSQVGVIAGERRACAVVSIRLGVGPLCGVEPGLLDRAFSVARRGTIAESAALIFETSPIAVRCRTCAGVSAASANRLVCAHCGDFRTDVISGDDLVLLSVELECADDPVAAAPRAAPFAAAP